jgi:hypothetical protein
VARGFELPRHVPHTDRMGGEARHQHDHARRDGRRDRHGAREPADRLGQHVDLTQQMPDRRTAHTFGPGFSHQSGANANTVE